MPTLLLILDAIVLLLLSITCIADFFRYRLTTHHYLTNSFYWLASSLYLVMGISNFILMAVITAWSYQLFLLALFCLFVSSGYAWAAERL